MSRKMSKLYGREPSVFLVPLTVGKGTTGLRYLSPSILTCRQAGIRACHLLRGVTPKNAREPSHEHLEFFDARSAKVLRPGALFAGTRGKQNCETTVGGEMRMLETAKKAFQFKIPPVPRN